MLRRMSLTNRDVDRIRGLCNRVGVSTAADMLGISRQSLLALLAGTGIKEGTSEIVQRRLGEGVTDTVTRGETSAKSDRTKRGAR